VEFKEPYLLAMRARAPKLFMALRRSGELDQHLDRKTSEAHDLLASLLGDDLNPSMAKRREAEEVVRATLIAFSADGTAKTRLPDRLTEDYDPLGRSGE
jgi:hypothetical protein